MTILNYRLIEADDSWADRYRFFCQQAYQAAYPKPELGLTPDLFSLEVFSTPRLIAYFQDTCSTSPTHKFWLALDGETILGGVVAERLDDRCEMGAFYIAPDLRSHGIGTALFEKVLAFSNELPIVIDVVKHMTDTIAVYEHWGFQIDASRGESTYPWPEWPETARQNNRKIYMVRPGNKR